MKLMKRIGAIVHLLASLVVLGGLTAFLTGYESRRIEELMSIEWVRIAVLVCVAIMALETLIAVIAAFAGKREPVSVHPGGNPNIEVTVDAVRSVAAKAAGEDDVMIEDVTARVRGRDNDELALRVDAIALAEQDLTALAERMEARISRACEQMLGAGGVTCRMRFLPTKTVTSAKEASGE